jgi:hypothetical protein
VLVNGRLALIRERTLIALLPSFAARNGDLFDSYDQRRRQPRHDSLSAFGSLSKAYENNELG